MKYIFFLALISLISCNNNNDENNYRFKTIELNGITVKGNMNKDSLFNGEVEYFSNGKLIEKRHFINGITNGRGTSFFPNGRIKQIYYDKNGLTDGELLQYDVTGNLIRKQYYFLGRLLGPQVYYDSLSNVNYYEFLNFENRSIYSKSYKSGEFSSDGGELLNTNFSNISINGKDYVRVFLYNITPFKFSCSYSICLMDSLDKLSVIDSVRTKNVYFEGDYPLIKGKSYSVCLNYFDSTQNLRRTLIDVFK